MLYSDYLPELSRHVSCSGPDDAELGADQVSWEDLLGMDLPSFRSAFLVLCRVLLNVIHECLKLRLEQRPAGEPSLLSIKQVTFFDTLTWLCLKELLSESCLILLETTPLMQNIRSKCFLSKLALKYNLIGVSYPPANVCICTWHVCALQLVRECKEVLKGGLLMKQYYQFMLHGVVTDAQGLQTNANIDEFEEDLHKMLVVRLFTLQ